MQRRGQRRLFALLLLACAALAGLSRWYTHARHFEDTDDAFIEGRVIPVAAKAEGYVVTLNVDDNQHVEAGQTIAEIDPRDYEAALAEARATLAASQRRLADANAKLAVMKAQVEQTNAARQAADADNAFAKQDADRYRAMSDGASSLQDRQRTASTELVSEAKVAGARSNVLAAQSSAAEGATNVAVAEAEVSISEAKVHERELDLSYTKIIAPQSGRIARRTVERGSYMKVGQTLLAIVSDDVWVLANFKETQLTDVRPGQPVVVSVDAYPGQTFAAHVDSIQLGTGGRFSLLPPENATGNYVKVVQRLPVKIRFDDRALTSHVLLAPGMSATPAVRVR